MIDLSHPPPGSWRKIYLDGFFSPSPFFFSFLLFFNLFNISYLDGPAALAKAIREHKGSLITDTTWRDAHQSHIGFFFFNYYLIFSCFYSLTPSFSNKDENL